MFPSCVIFLLLIWENSGLVQDVPGTAETTSVIVSSSLAPPMESSTDENGPEKNTTPTTSAITELTTSTEITEPTPEEPTRNSSETTTESSSTTTSRSPQTTTTTDSCGTPKVGKGSADTGQRQVGLSWPVSGCTSTTALAHIQIWDQNSSSSKCTNITLDQLSTCTRIQANVDVDYEANDQSCSMLEPFQYYNGSVLKFQSNPACSFVQQEGTDVVFRTPPRALTKIANADLNVPGSQSYCQSVSEGQIMLRLNATYFSNPGAPTIIGYHIVVGSAEQFSPDWFTSASSYGEARVHNFNSFYVTNEKAPLNPFAKPVTDTGCCLVTKDDQQSCQNDSGYTKSVDILIGDGTCDPKKDAHCVGLLPPGRAFWVGVLAVPDMSVCDSSVYCGELQKQIYLSSSITVRGKPYVPGKGPNVGAIVGGVFGGIALITIIIVGVIFYFKRCHKPQTQVVPSAISMVQTQTGRSRPIDLYRFEEILPDLVRDSGFLLLKEFSYLCDNSPSIRGQKHIFGLNDENMPKNRYVDILPFDDTRVKLAGDRYINASYIRGFNCAKEYIAAQGPMGENDRRTRGKYSTIDDFFEMIWQHDISCIVMLTQLMEAGRPKCAQYWPVEVGGIEQHGVFTVQLHIETDCGDFITRELELRKCGESRSILQYHYKRWPDMTVTDEQELLDFVRLVRLFVQTTHLATPLLVHCSAGVGRTGVFIALDILLQNIRQRSYVDIAGCVFALRQQRVRMVQTEDQYIMLYSAMGLAIQQTLQARQNQLINGDSVNLNTLESTRPMSITV